MRTRLGGLLALACLSAFVVVGSPEAGDAGSPIEPAEYNYVPEPAATLAGGLDVLVDETHGQVFVAQQRGDLLVTDLEGAPITTIPMPGAQNFLSLSDDGGTVFAKVWDASSGPSIMAVDATTHAVTVVAEATYAGCPIQPLEQHAGLLWFATSCGNSSNNDLGYIDPADGAVAGIPWPAQMYPDRVSAILGVPGHPERLVMVTNQGLHLLEITQGDVVTVERVALFSSSGAVTATAEEVLVADYFTVHRLSSADLEPLGSFNRGEEVSDLAVRSDGTLAVGVTGKDDIVVHAPGSSNRFRSYEFGSRSDRTHGVHQQGLAWGSDRLYAIVDGNEFYAFTPRMRAYVWMELPKRRFRHGEEIPIDVWLTGPATREDVVLWTVDRHGVRRRVAVVRPRDGKVTTTAIARRNGHFEVTFAGNERFDPAFDVTPYVRVAAEVRTRVPSGRSVGGVRVHRLSEPVVVRGKVLPNHAGDCLKLIVEVFAGGRWRDAISPCARLRGDSTVVARFSGAREIVGYKFRVRGYISEDRDNLSDAGRWHYFKFAR